MKPVKLKFKLSGFYNVEFGVNQPPYWELPALESHSGLVLTRWRFTWYERIQIFFGQDLFLYISTFHKPLQPVKLVVGKKHLEGSK